MNLDELKQVLSPLTDLGRGELTFDLEGLPITLHTLTPEEEIAAFRYARAALAEGDVADRATGMDYLDRFRLITLSYALVQAGPLDFRGVQYVTDPSRKLPNGTPVRVTKSEAVMEVMRGWSREMLTALFTRFGDLQFQVEDRVAKAINFDEIDFDGEVARLEERIVELKEQKARRTAGADDPRAETMAEAARRQPRMGRPEGAPAQEPLATPTEGEPPSVALPLDIPRALGEESEEKESAPVAPPVSVFEGVRRGEVPLPPTPPVPLPETPEVPPDFQSSFASPEEMETAQAESLRQAARQPFSVTPRPPHLSARQAYRDLNPIPPESPPAPEPGRPVKLPPPGVQARFRPPSK